MNQTHGNVSRSRIIAERKARRTFQAIADGWAALLAATVSLALGFVALSRIKRKGLGGRWAAIVGIGFGVVIYAIFIVYVVWDLIDPIEIHP